MNPYLNRRRFIQVSSALAGTIAFGARADGESGAEEKVTPMQVQDLPKGAAPSPVEFPHFPDRLHAFVWRNWQLVPTERLAKVVGTNPREILRIGRAMGLSGPPRITADQQRRSFITVIKRNWHLLPYEQLLALLDWTPEKMAFTLRL